MITTVVGSFPLEIKPPETFGEKLKNTLGLYDPYKKLIEELVELQFNLGIDIVTDGQVRDDMVGLFVKHIPGFVYKDNTSFIVSKIQKPIKSITVEDVKFAQNKLNSLTDDDNKGVKGIITGPSTIIHSSRIKYFYKNKNDAIIDYAYAIKDEAKSLENVGCKYIQIDEPFLSTGMVDIKTAKEAINIISKDIKIPVAMHVCGDISTVFKDLTSFNVDILDFEFAGNNTNINVLKENKDYLKDKIVGFGCIDSASQKLDDKSKVENLINKGVEIMGAENLILDPDCGLKKVPLSMVKEKLKLMNEFK